MACNCDPCVSSETNTPECESLSSQIQNFTTQFFGEVIKTEVDGAIQWSLPCSLDVGLENNPRGADEGLACYFLRLFQDGIIGLTGPQGVAGANGADGRNAYTVTLGSFGQPSLALPNVTVSTSYNPAILPGMYVFISTSGWYLVTNTDISGTLWLTLTRSLIGAPGLILAGKLVVPSGYPGVSVTGATGPQGPAGPQGDAGESFTATNGMYFESAGTNYKLQVTYASVDFVNSSARLLLPDAGIYLINVTVDLLGLVGVAVTDEVFFHLRDNNAAVVLDASEHAVSRMVQDKLDQVVFSVIYTSPGVNHTITLRGKCTSADVVEVVSTRTTLNYVRLA